MPPGVIGWVTNVVTGERLEEFIVESPGATAGLGMGFDFFGADSMKAFVVNRPPLLMVAQYTPFMVRPGALTLMVGWPDRSIAKRQVFYHAFQKIVNTEVPLAFLFEVPIETMYDKNLKNIPLGIWGGLNPYDEVYWGHPLTNDRSWRTETIHFHLRRTPMRVVIAMMKHETNTFSPLPTPFANFGRGMLSRGPASGDDAIAMVAGTNNAMAAFLDLARAQGWDMVVPIAANATPSGVVAREAFEAICAPIVEAVGQGCDAVLLDLHGAMVADGYDDPEGELLARIRKIAPQVPIAVAFDFHGNFSPVFFERRHRHRVLHLPAHRHVRHRTTGSAHAVAHARRRRPAPVVWRRLPMLTHMNRQTPLVQPMKDIMDRAIAAEAADEVLNASIFGGFPLADIPWVGLTVAVVADRAAARGEAAGR